MPLRIAVNYGRDAALEPEALNGDRPMGGIRTATLALCAAATRCICSRCVSAPGVTRWDRLPRSSRVCRVWPRAECGRVGSDPRGAAIAHAVAGASARCLVGQRLPGRRLRPVSSLVLGPRDWARWGDGAIVYHGATPPVYRSSRGQVTLAGRVHVEYPGHPQGQVRRGIQRCATGVLPGSSGRSTPPPSGVHEPGTARARSAT